MKITTTHLKQIIREELEKELSENEQLDENLVSTLQGMFKKGVITAAVFSQLLNAAKAETPSASQTSAISQTATGGEVTPGETKRVKAAEGLVKISAKRSEKNGIVVTIPYDDKEGYQALHDKQTALYNVAQKYGSTDETVGDIQKGVGQLRFFFINAPLYKKLMQSGQTI